jgi:hypothetical protein
LILEKTGIKGLSAYKIALYLLYVPFWHGSCINGINLYCFHFTACCGHLGHC